MGTTEQISHWDGSAVEPDVDAPLDGDATADVAIVGGGFTGLSTALHGAEAGLDCLVLEAERIGHGGSGRNVGLVNAGVWHPPAAVRAALGPTYGPRFVERFGAAPEYVFSLIEKHQIRCEPARNGTIHAAHAPRRLRVSAGATTNGGGSAPRSRC
jgi:glycine/D-amino acid oxidase-like deaminating enzyme